jgi:hypothetical protein
MKEMNDLGMYGRDILNCRFIKSESNIHPNLYGVATIAKTISHE